MTLVEEITANRESVVIDGDIERRIRNEVDDLSFLELSPSRAGVYALQTSQKGRPIRFPSRERYLVLVGEAPDGTLEVFVGPDERMALEHNEEFKGSRWARLGRSRG